MPHNGGRSQCNFWFPNVGEYAFIDFCKQATGWFLSNNGRPEPSIFDVNGFPQSMPPGGLGLRFVFIIPAQSDKPGNWKCRWTGGGSGMVVSANFTGSANITGSKTGDSGFFTCRPTATTINIGIAAFTLGQPVTKFQFYYEADEALLDAGQIFNPDFLSRMRTANYGHLRFLDWQYANVTNVTKWAHRKPVGYVYYNGHEPRALIYGGQTTNVGDAYSVAAPPEWAGLVDKATVTVLFTATSSGTSPTLNVGATGDVPIKNEYGDALTSTTKPTNVPDGSGNPHSYGTLTYESDLGCWLKFGGDNTAGFNPHYLKNGLPPEIMIALCEEIGAHPWFPQPFLTSAPITDFMSELATYCAGRSSASWMIPDFETINENWNFRAGFYGTRYAWNKALVRWGVSQQDRDFHGMIGSTLGQAISAVYGNDRTKYRVISGMQQAAGPNNSVTNPRLNSDRYVANTGNPNDAAKYWVTHIAPACYTFHSFTYTQLLSKALEFSTASAARQLELANELSASILVDGGDNAPFQGTVPYFQRRMASWKSWIDSLGTGLQITIYEGDADATDLVSDLTTLITGITKAVQAVVTLTTGTAYGNPLPPVGGQITFSNTVGGMTEIRGLTGTVLAVNGQNVTTDIDSSAFSTFTSGGSVTHVNSRTNINNLYHAHLNSDSLADASLGYLNGMVDVGVVNPSNYMFTGAGEWAALRPDIYAVNGDGKFQAHALFNAVSENAVSENISGGNSTAGALSPDNTGGGFHSLCDPLFGVLGDELGHLHLYVGGQNRKVVISTRNDLFTVFLGSNGPGGCALNGANVGDIVRGVIQLTSTPGDRASSFESIISVKNQIRQVSASDLSAQTFIVEVRRQS